MGRKFASGKHGKSISDRSGQTFPYKEMIKEPGTGLWIHKSETDGKWNRVDHPRNFIKVKSDPQALRYPHPEQPFADNAGLILIDTGIPFMFDDNLPLEF